MNKREEKRSIKAADTVRGQYHVIRSAANWPSECDVEYADSVLRAEYYRGVTSRAVSFVADLKSGEHKDEESFRESFQQAIDGDHDVIYTRCAESICYVSDYRHDARDYLVDELGFTEIKDFTPERIAYVCLEHDVWEAIELALGSSVDEYLSSRV